MLTFSFNGTHKVYSPKGYLTQLKYKVEFDPLIDFTKTSDITNFIDDTLFRANEKPLNDMMDILKKAVKNLEKIEQNKTNNRCEIE